MIWYDVRWCDVMWCLPNSHVSTQKKSASQVTLQTAYPKNKPWRFATSHSKVFVRSWKEKSYPKTSPYYFFAWENCLLWAAVSRCPPPRLNFSLFLAIAHWLEGNEPQRMPDFSARSVIPVECVCVWWNSRSPYNKSPKRKPTMLSKF